jgi:hypothetical protein
MKAKFIDLKFVSSTHLSQWLAKETYKMVDLKDKGQDMQRIWIHKTGEILNADFHSALYCGKFVDLTNLSEGKPIQIWDNESESYIAYSGLIVEEITN